MTRAEAIAIAGTLSKPSKMPCYSYGLPAEECATGSKLANITGSVCSGCYALKGFYKTFAKTVKPAQYRRLEAIESPRWVEAMVVLIGATKNPWFRWHDSGDLQDVAHLRKIVAVAVALPKVKFWLPTREYAIIKQYLTSSARFPKNLCVRVSAHMVDGKAPEVGLPTSTVHTVRPIGVECRARSQNNECRKCRMCWDTRVKNVSYHLH